MEKKIIPDIKVPLWLEIYYRSDEWDKARDQFFSRLNEYRDQLRNKFPYPVIILVPFNYKSRLREIAPDLWPVISHTDEFLSNILIDKNPNIFLHASAANQYYDFTSKTKNAIDIQEWQKTLNTQVSDFELFQVGWCAFNLGDRKQAEEIINNCLAVINNQSKKQK